MGKHRIVISMLACKDCGSWFPIPRKTCRLREKEHVKDIWCYRCKRVTKFIENIDPRDLPVTENVPGEA